MDSRERLAAGIAEAVICPRANAWFVTAQGQQAHMAECPLTIAEHEWCPVAVHDDTVVPLLGSRHVADPAT